MEKKKVERDNFGLTNGTNRVENKRENGDRKNRVVLLERGCFTTLVILTPIIIKNKV